MSVTLGAVRASVIGARDQPASTPGLSRASTRAPMPARGARPIVGEVLRPFRWMLPFFAVVLGVLVVSSAFQQEPEPALHGRGLLISAALAVFIALLGFGVVFRSRLVDPRASWRLLGGIGACALVLALAQPDGAGVLALYITLGVSCARLEPRTAIPLFTGGIIVVSALHELIARDGTVVDTIVADASAIVFFYMGYIARQFRLGQARAEELLEELEASRATQAHAVALGERQHLAREMHDVLAHSLSALTVQLEGARLLARNTGADQSVIDAVQRSHHLAKGGLEEARRAIEALRGGDMPGPGPARRARHRVPGADRDRHRPGAVRGAARAVVGGAAGRLPDGAGGADERAPPRRRRAGRRRAALRGRRHVAHRRGPRGGIERRARAGARLRADRHARARGAARRPARRRADRARLPDRALPPRMTDDDPIRVLLADDQRVVREGLAMLLDLLPGIEVVGTAGDGEEAVALAVARAPDVILMDLRMPRMDGVEATRRIAEARPQARVIALTTYADEPTVLSALRAGARGYLTKDAGAEEIHAAITAVARGQAALDPAVQGHVLAGLVEGAPGGLPDGLTPREAEVLRLIAEGLSNAQIADRLVVSPATVKSHVNRVFAKAGVRDRAQAVAYAYQNRLSTRTRAAATGPTPGRSCFTCSSAWYDDRTSGPAAMCSKPRSYAARSSAANSSGCQ